jgi:ferredoxin
MIGVGVDQLGSVLTHLESRPIRVALTQCCRLRHRRSTCTLCADMCAVQAINWDDSLQLDPDTCTGCGVCAAVCPTGALEVRAPSREDLLVQIQRITRDQDWVAFACPRALSGYGGRAQCLNVSCLGRLDESLLMSAVAEGAQSVWLVDGTCEACPQAVGRTIAGAAAARSNALLAAFGRPAAITFRSDPPAVLRSGGADRGSAEGVSRRGMFKALARETARVGEITAETRKSSEWEQKPQEKPRGELPRALPSGRLLLLAALKRLGSPVQPIFQGDEDGLFAKFALGDACTACQMCAFFCPTGALTKVEDGERVGLAFSVAACTNCGLCQDICYRDAVLLTHLIDLNEVLALSVEWLFVEEMDTPPWRKPPGERLGRQILDMLGH